MSQYKDYQKPTVGQAGCTYSQLGNIYSGMSAERESVKMADYIVPKFCPNGGGPNYPPKYDALTHGKAYLCGGYFDVKSAYPYAGCNTCQSEFVKRPCKGTINQQCMNPKVNSYKNF